MGGKTTKAKIQAYVADEIQACFESEALKRGITESKLIEQILAERYGLANPQAESATNPQAESVLIQKQIAESEGLLAKRLEAELHYGLAELWESLDSKLNSRLLELEASTNSRLDIMLDTKLAAIHGSETMERLATTFNASEVTVTYSTDKGLSQRQLAKRLGCCVKGLQQRRDNPEELLEWTKRDGVGWEYREGKYYVKASTN